MALSAAATRPRGALARIGTAVATAALVALVYALLLSPLYTASARIEAPSEEAAMLEELTARLSALQVARGRGLSGARDRASAGTVWLRQSGSSSLTLTACAASPHQAADWVNGLALDALAGRRRMPLPPASVADSATMEVAAPQPRAFRATKVATARASAEPSPFLVTLRAKWRQWEKQEQAPADDPVLAGLIREDAEIVRLRKDLAAAELSLRQSLTHLTPRHPDVKRLAATTETLQAALENRIAGLIAEYRESLRREWAAAEAAEKVRLGAPPAPATFRSVAAPAPAVRVSPPPASDVCPAQMAGLPLHLVLAPPPSRPDWRWSGMLLLFGSCAGLLIGLLWCLVAVWLPATVSSREPVALGVLERRLAWLIRE